jgi:hypothetical protein
MHNKGREPNPGKVNSLPATPLFTKKERSMNTLPHIPPSDKLYTPRPGAPVRYASYSGFEGYASVTDAWQLLFRTSGSLWYPVLDQADLVILGLVGEAECQLVLDTLAGGYTAIATSRQNLEV